MWLILLFITNFVLAKTISDGFKCQTNEDCVFNSMCFHNECVCQVGYRSDGVFRCVNEIRYRRQINFGKVCFVLF